MPIKVPNDLPAIDTLTKENVFVMTDTRAMTQDVRPLHILLLNLMPTKIDTETQLARLLGNTPLQIELELLQTATHKAHNVSQEHMIAFYKTFSEIQDEYFDGMIITGAPVEKMEFEEVDYWEELSQHVPYLLGCSGRIVLPLRHSEAHAAEEAVRRVLASSGSEARHAVPRF